MIKLRVVINYGEFYFSKDFEVSAVPRIGTALMTQMAKDGGYICATVKSVNQYLEQDFFQVYAEVSLRGICILYFYKAGWQPHGELGPFLANRKVKKTLEEIGAEAEKLKIN